MHMLYRQAAEALDRCMRGVAGLKTACLGARVHNKPATYAITAQTLKHRKLLQAVLDRTGLPAAQPELSQPVLLVLLYELLVGPAGKLRGGGQPVRAVLAAEAELRDALAAELGERGVATAEALLDDPKLAAAGRWPRYARVNRLLAGVDEVVEELQGEQFELAAQVDRACPRRFARDDLLDDVLLFAPGTDLHAHPLVSSGKLILQDKASCFPGHVLQPAEGSHVIDACAAPGNKTSHVAGLAGKQGRVFAFDLSKKRCELLRSRMRQAGASNVRTECTDFLKVNPMQPKYAQVEYILLDPSCSGSGMLDQGVAEAPEMDGARLERLAQFQLAAILHAFKFPRCVRVSYSTCSVHKVENEDVVAAACENGGELGWRLVRCLDGWPRRGEGFEGAEMCVRADPLEDATNGFFVACFERSRSDLPEPAPQPVGGEGTGARKKQKRKAADKLAESVKPGPVNHLPGAKKKRKRGKPNAPILVRRE